MMKGISSVPQAFTASAAADTALDYFNRFKVQAGKIANRAVVYLKTVPGQMQQNKNIAIAVIFVANSIFFTFTTLIAKCCENRLTNYPSKGLDSDQKAMKNLIINCALFGVTSVAGNIGLSKLTGYPLSRGVIAGITTAQIAIRMLCCYDCDDEDENDTQADTPQTESTPPATPQTENKGKTNPNPPQPENKNNNAGNPNPPEPKPATPVAPKPNDTQAQEKPTDKITTPKAATPKPEKPSEVLSSPKPEKPPEVEGSPKPEKPPEVEGSPKPEKPPEVEGSPKAGDDTEGDFTVVGSKKGTKQKNDEGAAEKSETAADAGGIPLDNPFGVLANDV